MMIVADNDAPRPSLTAQWRDLILLNFRVEPALLRPYLPAGTELDLWRGDAYVSLVGFRFLETKILGMSVPFHRNFEEVNLRFYVQHGERRGVTFIQELVPRRAVAFVARALYGENYRALPMRHSVDRHGAAYRWRWRNEWSGISMRWREPRDLSAGSHEEFIAEHYWGFTRVSETQTTEYRVEHPAWQIRDAESASVEGNLSGLYPPEFASLWKRPPDSAFGAVGSAVAVRRGKTLGITF